jgi:hypothetical protein
MVNLQEEIAEATVSVDAVIDSSLKFTDLVKAMGKGRANIHPQVVTNKFIGNAHSGNISLHVSRGVEHAGTEFEKWVLMLPSNGREMPRDNPRDEIEHVESCVRGGQTRSPDLISMMSRQTRNWNQELQKFPACLMAMLRDDDGSGLCDQAIIRSSAQALWKKIKCMHSTIFFELTMNTSARIELFPEHKEDHTFETENLSSIGSLSSPVQQLNRHRFASHLNQQSSDCVVPIDKLLSDDAANFVDGRRTNVQDLSQGVKAGLVMNAEKTVMITDSFPWIGPMHKRALQNLTMRQKCKAWSTPMECRLKLRPSTKLLTGLEFGVSPDLLLLPHGDFMQPFTDGSSFLRSGAQTDNLFWLVNKKRAHAIQLNQTHCAMICLLQQHSCAAADGEQNIDLDDCDFSSPPAVEQPFHGAFFGEINCSFIANELDIGRRDQLFMKVALLIHRLCDSFSHCLVTSMNKRKMRENSPLAPTKLSQFPRTKNQFNNHCKNHFEGLDLSTAHLSCGPTDTAIRTVSESLLFVVVVVVVVVCFSRVSISRFPSRSSDGAHCQ